MTDVSSETDAAPAVRRKPVVRYVLVGVVVAAALIAGIVWFIHYRTVGQYRESTNDAFVTADAVTVSPKTSGYVDQVFVTDNQDVKAGQPLVRIDPRDYRAQTAQYRAQLAIARANADNVRATIIEQQAGVAQAQAELAASRASASFAAGEVARYGPLAQSGAETREKLATLSNQASQAAQQVAARAAALTSAQRRIGSLEAQLRQAQAQGEEARAMLGAADVNLASTIVRASVAGRIGDKGVRQGQYVAAGTRLMQVVPIRAIYITANFKETQIGLVRRGQSARVKVDALPGVILHGRVDSLAPGTGAQFSLLPPQNATGNFTKIVQRIAARITIDAPPVTRALLIPGMSTEVTIDTRGAQEQLDRLSSDTGSK